MANRPHRSHGSYRHRPVAGPARSRRRVAAARPSVLAQSAAMPATQTALPPVFVGMLFGLPPALLLWAGLYEIAKATF